MGWCSHGCLEPPQGTSQGAPVESAAHGSLLLSYVMLMHILELIKGSVELSVQDSSEADLLSQTFIWLSVDRREDDLQNA